MPGRRHGPRRLSTHGLNTSKAAVAKTEISGLSCASQVEAFSHFMVGSLFKGNLSLLEIHMHIWPGGVCTNGRYVFLDWTMP